MKQVSLINRGIGYDFFKRISERFEINKNIALTSLTDFEWITFLKILDDIFPTGTNHLHKYECQILILELITTYRGWRHSKGLPLRGQRTWSNASSSKKSNLTLRQVQERLARFFYNNSSLSEINLAYIAEKVNLLWKIQWNNDWNLAKKRLKHARRKNQRAPMKIDIHSMAKGNVFIGNEEIKSQKKNKKKKHVPKNVFSLGFDPGFTKAIVKEMVRAKYTDEKLAEQKALFSPESKKNKSNKKKKKTDVKAKIAAHNLKKKNKKSVWD